MADAPTTAGAPRPSRAPGHRLGRWGAAGLVALVLAPVLVVLATRTGRPYTPVQDIAVIDLRVRDVWSLDTPLTGAYSRLGWSHPGPLLYQLLAPLSLLSGGAAWATLVGAAALQGGALAWIAAIAWRRGRLPLMALWLAVAALACAATGPYLLLEAWNPHVALPAFVLVLLQAWSVATGDDARLPGFVFAGSFVVQAHIGYLPLVAAIAAWALLRRRGAVHRSGLRLRDVAPWPAAAAVAAVVWAAPIIENVVHPPGNGYEVARAFLVGGGQGEPAGPVQGSGLMGAMFRVVPPWAGGVDLVEPLEQVADAASPAWLIIPLVLAAVAARVTRRDPLGEDRMLVELAVLVLVVGTVALMRVTGSATPYLFYWRVAIGPFCILAPLWVVARSWRPQPTGGAPAVVTAVLVVATIVPSLSLAADVADHPDDVMAFESVTVELLDQVEDPTGRVLLRVAGTPLGGVHGGVLDELDRRGVDVRVDARRPYQFGYDRLGSSATVDEVWYVIEEGRYLSLLSQLPEASIVAQTAPLDPDAEAELVELQRSITDDLLRLDEDHLVAQLDSPLVAFALADLPGLSVEDADRLAQLNAEVGERSRCRCAIVAFPAEVAPCKRAVRRNLPEDQIEAACRGQA
ncbi:hypothetical protein HC251_07320 [Iamia sp. SCSIO 61187]|uniref:hypothetical protein n=1 Tax=Iamia sp. SCSIO 61187 TaxID=2722752 RepID=UPI001C6362A9|nr:hypothetical protein [Iamia sp. SCSIO 61187]QYG92267.1 hypothetical protein HC251_07320 [Iamia sp. SCSIO 61187]